MIKFTLIALFALSLAQEPGAEETAQPEVADDKHPEVTAEQLQEIYDKIMPLFGLRKFDSEALGSDSEEVADNEVDEVDVKEIADQISPIMVQWDEFMENFQPEDYISFDVEEGQVEVLYEYIQSATVIRGAYFIPSFNNEQHIDFLIRGPANEIVHSKVKVQEGLFKIDLPKGGEYSFVFQNKRSKSTQTVTFALDVHNSTREHLQVGDLEDVDQRVTNIHNAMRDNYFVSKMSSQKYESGNIVLQAAHQKLLIFSIIEVFGIFGITLWQIVYMKRLLGSERII